MVLKHRQDFYGKEVGFNGFVKSYANTTNNNNSSSSSTSVNKTQITHGKKLNGSIRIKDAKLYRWRDNHGRKGNHYTRWQLEKIFREATAEGPVPILHTHNYRTGPIGYLQKYWFGNDGWLHVSFKLYSKARMGNDWRYNTLVSDFRRGLLNMVSLSVVQRHLGGDRWDPNVLSLNEISVCRKGDHKNCDIRVIEASESDNKNLSKPGGEIMSLEIQTGGVDVTKEKLTIDQLVGFAAENGVEFSQEELTALASMPEGAYLSASSIVLRKLAAKANMSDMDRKQLEEEAELGRRLKTERETEYRKQKESEVKEITDFFEAEYKAGGIKEEEWTEIKEMASKMGSVPEAKNALKMMMMPIQKAKAAATAQQEAEKARTTATNQLRAAERRDRETLTHRAASTPLEKRSAPSTDANAAKRTKPSKPDFEIETKPENLAQRLAPKMDNNGNVVVDADANGSHQLWIDNLFPRALQSSMSKAVESATMKMLQEDMGHPDFVQNASSTIIPPIGQQGFSKTSTSYSWGKSLW